jgi:predicted nucleic acid-binding protein
VIVVDTGAMIALIDRDDKHHETIKAIYEADPDAWLLPWAILPEVDYLLGTHVSRKAEEAFLKDLADGGYRVEWGEDADVEAAQRIAHQHRALALGLVDASVIAITERLRAKAIVTVDVRHFGAVRIAGNPKLLPRDS